MSNAYHEAARWISIAVGCALLAGPAWPEPATAGAGADISLRQAVQTAIANSHDVSRASRDLAASGAQVRVAKSLRAPKVSLLASQAHLGETLAMTLPSVTLDLPGIGAHTLSLPALELAKQDETRLSAQVTLPLYTSGAIENSVASARFGQQASVKALAAQKNDVALEVVIAYLRAQLAYDVEGVNREALSVVQRHLDDTQKLYASGVVAQYDVLRADKERASQEKRLTDAANQRDLAVLALLNTMSVPLNTQARLTTPLATSAFSADTEATVKQAVASSDAAQALRLKAQAEEALGRALRAQDKPTVAVSAMYQVDHQDLTALEPKSVALLTVSWRLFDGGAAKARQEEQRQQAAKSLDEKRKAEDAIAMLVHQACDDLAAGRKSLEAADRTLALAEEGLRLAFRRFETGVGTSVETVDAILGVSQAKVERAGALFQIDSAYYRILHLTNRLLPEMTTPLSTLDGGSKR